MSILKIGPPDFVPALVIFDKDGTLIDFHVMWAAWIRELARRLESASKLCVANKLFDAMGFEPFTATVVPGGALAISSMADLRNLTDQVVRAAGLSQAESEKMVAAAWHVPDPVSLAQPLADLPLLFGRLREHGIKIAIATSDDRVPTEKTLQGLGLTALVEAIIGADDRLPIKPAGDMVLHLCQALDVEPARTVLVGDSIADLQMGRAASVGLVIGVLSGVSSADDLAPYADELIPSVAHLI